jgi:hypothetical protein
MLAFLSYSRHDRGLVDRFEAELRGAGIEVWRDTDEIRGGEEWRRSIVDAIQAADAVVLFVSPSSMASDNVRRELTVAEEEGKEILPVRLVATEISDDFRYSLAGVQYVDVTAMSPREGAAAVRAAVIAIAPAAAAPGPGAATIPGAVAGAEAGGERSTGHAGAGARAGAGTRTATGPGRGRKIGAVVALVVVALVVLVILVSGGGGDGPSAPSAADARPANSGSEALQVGETHVVDQRFGYGAFAVRLGRATLRAGKVSIDAVFENLAPTDFQFDPSRLALVSKGNVYNWSGDPVPKVAGESKASGTLVFTVYGPFDFADAALVAGGSDQNQAVVPLSGGSRQKLLLPRQLDAAGKASAGTLTVEVVGGQVTAGDFTYNQQAAKGKVIVHLDLRAATSERFGANFLGGHLALSLPNGEQVAPKGGSNAILVTGATTEGLYADFEVPEAANGDYVLVVQNLQDRAQIPFKIS